VGLGETIDTPPRDAPRRERDLRRRKKRRRQSEEMRLSAGAKYYKEENAEKQFRDRSWVSFEEVAAKFKLKSPNPVKALSRHLASEGLSARSLAPPGEGDAEEEDATPEPEPAEEMEVSIVEEPRGRRLGRCGRKPLSDAEKLRRKTRAATIGRSSERHVYEDRVQEATLKIAMTPVGEKSRVARSLKQSLFDDACIKTISAKSLVRLARTSPGMRPAVQGGSIFTREEEDKIDQFVRSLRSRKFFVPPDLVMIYADHLILETDVRRKEFSREGFSKGIWNGLKRRLPIHTGTGQNLDTLRAKWTTAENILKWYHLFENIVVKEGIYEENPEWDPENPQNADRLNCLHRERVFSLDETDMSIGQELKKSKKDIGVFCDVVDDHNVATSRSSRKITWLFARSGAGKMLPPLIVYGDSKTVKDEWKADVGDGDFMDDQGKPLPNMYAANDTGSVTTQVFHDYVEQVLIPCAKASGVRNEDGKRGILIADGVQTHLNHKPTMELLKNAGILYIVRVPHSSSDTQGEDTVIFQCASSTT